MATRDNPQGTAALAVDQSREHRWRNRLIALMAAAALSLAALSFADPSEIVNWWRAITEAITGEKRTTRPSIDPETLIKAAAPREPKGNDTSVSKDPQSLILVATDPGATAADGVAFIGTSADSPQTYKVGAILTNGARIAEIKGDHVVLSRQALSERLYQESVPLNKRIAQGPPTLSRVGGPQPFTPAEATVRNTFTDYIRPNPVFEQGAITGYEVQPGQSAAVLAQLGLRAGDIIVSLNGVPLTNAEVTISFFESLADGAVMEAVVQRKGERIELQLDGGLIVEAERRAALPRELPPLPALP